MSVSSGTYRTSVPITGRNAILFAFDIHLMLDALRQSKDAAQVKIKVVSARTPFLLEADGHHDFAMVCPALLSNRLMAA